MLHTPYTNIRLLFFARINIRYPKQLGFLAGNRSECSDLREHTWISAGFFSHPDHNTRACEIYSRISSYTPEWILVSIRAKCKLMKLINIIMHQNIHMSLDSIRSDNSMAFPCRLVFFFNFSMNSFPVTFWIFNWLTCCTSLNI